MAGESLHPARTYLFVPGTRPERFVKALATGADRVVLDLEDAVSVDDKGNARSAIATWLHDATPTDRSRVVVRINDAGSPWFAADLLTIFTSRSVALPVYEAVIVTFVVPAIVTAVLVVASQTGAHVPPVSFHPPSIESGVSRMSDSVYVPLET